MILMCGQGGETLVLRGLCSLNNCHVLNGGISKAQKGHLQGKKEAFIEYLLCTQ